MRIAIYGAIAFAAILASCAHEPMHGDTVEQQEQELGRAVVARTQIEGFDLQPLAPSVRIDAGAQVSFYDGTETNTVHEAHWSQLPGPIQAQVNRWALATDEPDGEHLFNDMFYRFFFVHELGHWMTGEVLAHRADEGRDAAQRNAQQNRWEYEFEANRISVAWWRETDPSYLDRLVSNFRAMQRALPNPVPPGESPRHYFSRAYDTLAADPDKYGWHQLQMVIAAYDELPRKSFHQVLSELPARNFESAESG